MNASVTASATLARHVPELAPSPPAQINLLTTSPIAIVDDGGGVASELARRLTEGGYDAALVDDVDAEHRQIIDLRGITSVDTIDDALSIQRQAFQSARATGEDIETFVLVFDTGATFGLHSQPAQSAWLGGLSALAKTAHLEWQAANIKAIDIAADEMNTETTAQRIADELLCGGPQLEVALAPDGERHAVRTRSVALDDPAQPAIDGDDIVIASGGARGVTAGCLIELAEQCGPTIILLGRTPLEDESEATENAESDAELKRALIDAAQARGDAVDIKTIGQQAATIRKCREIRATVDAIEAAGSTVRYKRADVRDRKALGEVFEQVRREFGAPSVLIHAAGVLADKRIRQKKDEQFDFVFNTKVDGLRALLEVSADDPLRHLVVFSSVAARTGNVGQVDYAMANETMNKVARAVAEDRQLVAHALNWGPWDGGMVDDSLRAHFQSQGVSLIDPHGGARAFCRELQPGKPSAEVVLGGGLPEAAGERHTHIGFYPASHPELAGHIIDGNTVVPAALVVDLFANIARSSRPDQFLCSLQDVQVQKGIQLPDFHDPEEAARFTVLVADNDDGSMTLKLCGLDGTPHYRATAEFSASPAVAEALNVPDDFDDHRCSGEALYDDILFHTEPFDVIDAVDGFGQRVARATLKKTTPAIAIDAGVQLALVQGVAANGRSNLPTAIDSFTDFGLSSADGDSQDHPLEIIAATQQISALKSVSHIDIVDATGDVLASIRGLQMHFFGDPLPSQPNDP